MSVVLTNFQRIPAADPSDQTQLRTPSDTSTSGFPAKSGSDGTDRRSPRELRLADQDRPARFRGADRVLTLGVRRGGGARLLHETVQPTFHQLVHRAGLEQPSWSPHPKVHGLRHSFVVDTLISWCRDGRSTCRAGRYLQRPRMADIR
jgi:hypothetical protein